MTFLHNLAIFIMNKTNIYLFKAMKMDGVNEAVAASGSAGAAYSSGKALAAFGVLGGMLMTVIVITFNPPKSHKETFAAIISSLVCSLGGACGLILYFGIPIPSNLFGLIVFMALCFMCAGPGWFLVRLLFRQMEKFQGKDVGQIIKIVKGWFK